MTRTISVIATTVALSCAGASLAQNSGMKRSNNAVIPTSSMNNPADASPQAHTNIQVPGNYQMLRNLTPQASGSPFPGFIEDPASLACVYLFQLQPQASGCNPSSALPNPSGGSRAIAIVDAYDNPGAYADLLVFTEVFGVQPITPSTFLVVFAPAGGSTVGSCTPGPASRPPVDTTGNWELEESLDVDYAHAMAPGATLYLVEAQSNSDADLYCAVTVASNLVQAAGGGEVSMSWGRSEFATETAYDAMFTTPGVVYFAASGDGPGVIYPSVSPNVISVGGTTLSRNAVTGSFVQENGWQQGGGGISAYEPRPAYQSRISNIVGSNRGVPDVSADANPYTGVWVSDNFMPPPVCPPQETCYFFYQVGGTSLAAPLWAGMVNAANSFAPSTAAELTKLYQDSADGDFTDITAGSCGLNMGYLAAAGWDFCSGIGSPKFYTGK